MSLMKKVFIGILILGLILVLGSQLIIMYQGMSFINGNETETPVQP